MTEQRPERCDSVTTASVRCNLATGHDGPHARPVADMEWEGQRPEPTLAEQPRLCGGCDHPFHQGLGCRAPDGSWWCDCRFDWMPAPVAEEAGPLDEEAALTALMESFVTIRAPREEWRQLLAPYRAAIRARLEMQLRANVDAIANTLEQLAAVTAERDFWIEQSNLATQRQDAARAERDAALAALREIVVVCSLHDRAAGLRREIREIAERALRPPGAEST